MSSFEYLELYKQIFKDFDEEKIFKFIGIDGKTIALRWDYTISIAKYYSMKKTKAEAKYSYFGKVFRKEKRYSGNSQEEYRCLSDD